LFSRWRPTSVRLAASIPGFGVFESTGIIQMRERWQKRMGARPLTDSGHYTGVWRTPAQYGCDPRFESRFHKNCVAYHFRGDLDMTFGFCPAKEKSRESGGSFFYRYLSDRGSARRSYFAECLSAAMRLLMWFASRLSWRWSCLVRWPLSFAMSRFSLFCRRCSPRSR
jgi:hypothetical protein